MNLKTLRRSSCLVVVGIRIINLKIKYLKAKEKSLFTYSSLYMMLNYVLNRGYFESGFIAKINEYLKRSDFRYNIHIINKRLIFNNPNERSPWIETKELSEGEQTILLVLLWQFNTRNEKMEYYCLTK